MKVRVNYFFKDRKALSRILDHEWPRSINLVRHRYFSVFRLFRNWKPPVLYIKELPSLVSSYTLSYKLKTLEWKSAGLPFTLLISHPCSTCEILSMPLSLPPSIQRWSWICDNLADANVEYALLSIFGIYSIVRVKLSHSPMWDTSTNCVSGLDTAINIFFERTCCVFRDH